MSWKWRIRLAIVALAAFTTGMMVAIAISPKAHASPDTYYLECITPSGGQVTDTAQELRLGQLVQEELLQGVARTTVVSRLIADNGANWDRAEIIVTCAARTELYG